MSVQHETDMPPWSLYVRCWGVEQISRSKAAMSEPDPKRTLGRDKLCTNSGHFGKVIFFQRVAQRHRVLVGCAAASMRYHDEIRVFSRLMAKSVVGNNQ